VSFDYGAGEGADHADLDPANASLSRLICLT
jgi:hypothetical protein